jgi:ribosomal protein S13
MTKAIRKAVAELLPEMRLQHLCESAIEAKHRDYRPIRISVMEAQVLIAALEDMQGVAEERAEVERLKGQIDTLRELRELDNKHIENLKQQLEAVKWRPIEEAPKDGTWVLAYWKTNVFMMSRWFENENKWSDNNGYPMKDPPTHFIPLSALGEPET